MSADQALTRMRERVNSSIHAAVATSSLAQLQKSINVTLRRFRDRRINVMLRHPCNSNIRLVSTDGVPAREGSDSKPENIQELSSVYYAEA